MINIYNPTIDKYKTSAINAISSGWILITKNLLTNLLID